MVRRRHSRKAQTAFRTKHAGGLGHPEGYFEAFANLYSELADVIGAKRTGRDALGFPVALDGAKGLAFVEAFLRSYRSGGTWTNVEAIQ
jgi:hypothetical protein